MCIERRPDVHGCELQVWYLRAALVEGQLGQAVVEVDEHSICAREKGGEDEEEEDGR